MAITYDKVDLFEALGLRVAERESIAAGLDTTSGGTKKLERLRAKASDIPIPSYVQIIL